MHTSIDLGYQQWPPTFSAGVPPFVEINHSPTLTVCYKTPQVLFKTQSFLQRWLLIIVKMVKIHQSDANYNKIDINN